MSNEFLSEFKSLKTFVIVFGSLFVLAMILNIIQPVFQIFLMFFMGILFSVFLSGIGFLIKSKVNVSYRTAVTIAILAILVLSLLGGWFMGRQAIK